MITIIDHYDSFVMSLARYVERLGVEVDVISQDAMTPDAVLARRPRAIILSPGPGVPDDAGLSLALTRQAAGSVPILGVCLGHQIIAQAFGAQLIRSHPAHGITGEVTHDGLGVFADLPNPMTVGRYHALIAVCFPDCLRACAHMALDGDGNEFVMGFTHRDYPLWGVQFHPESVLTPAGDRLITNFVALADRAL